MKLKISFNHLTALSLISSFILFIACDTGTRQTEEDEETTGEIAEDENVGEQILEPGEGWYDEWDANNNNLLENDEFSELATSNFDDWDMNDNNMLDKEEIAANWSYTFPMDYRDNWMSEWDGDSDGNLSQDEFNQGVFEFLDIDDSGALENDELYLD